MPEDKRTMTEKVEAIRKMVVFGLENGKGNMVVDLDVLDAIYQYVPQAIDPTLQRMHDHLHGPEANSCYLCGDPVTEWMSFASKERTTNMELCKTHFDGLREELREYVRETRHIR